MPSYFFDRGQCAQNASLRGQYDFLQAQRAFQRNSESAWASIPMPGMACNAAAPVPYPVYAQMDTQTKRVMAEPGSETLLLDLMPLALPLGFGTMVHQYKQIGDGGAVTTSMSGLEPVPNDQTEHNYDSALVPVHQSGYYREAREMAGLTEAGWSTLLDDQEASTRTVRKRMSDYLLDGAVDKNGRPLRFKGVESYGVRTSKHTVKVALSVDLTSLQTAPDTVRNQFIALRDRLRVDNRVDGDVTVYVSNEIEATLDRYYVMEGVITATRSLRQELESLAGIGAIKPLSKLKGNQLLMGAVRREYIRPLLGQAVSNLALPRNQPFARHQFMVWSAMGLEMQVDIDGRSGWLYAASEE
ncbi:MULTISPECIES: major capsid protein [unclassified Halomonas]|uniref:major capsid protein n=1 Tax=unclassified Halomonas TaxID=2609666 RepID=UPI0020769E21|nr:MULTISPECIES: major capsid protein [unclassified Halomonas]